MRAKITKSLTGKFPNGSLARRFISGVAWSLFGTVCSRSLNLISFILIARLMDKTGYGELGIIQSTTVMFGTFAGLGLGVTATKYIAEYRTTQISKAGGILSLSVMIALLTGASMAIILATFSYPLAAKYLAAPHLAPLLRLASVLLFFETLNGVLVGGLAGFESFRIIARVNLISGVSTFPVTVVGTWFFGLEGAIHGLIFFSFASCALNYRALRDVCKRNNIRLSFVGCIKEWKILWHFTLPSFISGAMVGPIIWLCNAMLVKQPNGYEEMAVMNVANQWRTFLLLLPGIFAKICLPMLSSSLGLEEGDQFSKIVDYNQRASIITIIPMTVLFLFSVDYILGLYGDTYLNGVPVIVGILVGMAISSIGSPAGAAIQAKGKMWIGVCMNTLWGISYLIFVSLTVSTLGARSLAYGFAMSHLILLLLGYAYLYRDLPKGMFPRTIFSVLFIIIIAISSVQLPNSLRHIMLVPALAVSLIFIYLSTIRQNSLYK